MMMGFDEEHNFEFNGTSRSTPFLLRSIRSIIRWLSMLLTFRWHSSLRLSPAVYIIRSIARWNRFRAQPISRETSS